MCPINDGKTVRLALNLFLVKIVSPRELIRQSVWISSALVLITGDNFVPFYWRM